MELASYYDNWVFTYFFRAVQSYYLVYIKGQGQKDNIRLTYQFNTTEGSMWCVFKIEILCMCMLK